MTSPIEIRSIKTNVKPKTAEAETIVDYMNLKYPMMSMRETDKYKSVKNETALVPYQRPKKAARPQLEELIATSPKMKYKNDKSYLRRLVNYFNTIIMLLILLFHIQYLSRPRLPHQLPSQVLKVSQRM